MSDVVALEGVTVAYEGERTPTIHDVTLRIARGEHVVVVGPNGAGKTTLLEAINGMLPATAGRVTVLGMDVGREGHRVRARVGYVVQNFLGDPLDPFLARDVVMMGRAGRIGLLRRPRRADWEAVDRAMAAMGVAHTARRPVGKLSGGEFQKVLLARAMAQGPEVALLDEPLSHLDVDARASAREALEAWRRASGVTLVEVSHDLGGVPPSADRLVVLEGGRVTLDGRAAEVLASDRLRGTFRTWGGCCHP
jgi:zinc/manganese transport system ATP-binding protein